MLRTSCPQMPSEVARTTENIGSTEMIRIITLNDDKKGTGDPAYLRELTNQLRLAEIDILCCQGMQRTLDGKQDPAREIAESLQMTSIFSATDCRMSSRGRGKETTISGLSILA